MKILMLMRHAKSSWDDPDLSDFERPLNKRGHRDAPSMGKMILEKELAPDLIISSPAKRAKQTAVLVRKNSLPKTEIKFVERIYEARPEVLLRILAELSNDYDRPLLVGHNPGIEGFLALLTGEFHTMPTASLAKVDLSIENWADLRPNCGITRFVLRPKELWNRVDV